MKAILLLGLAAVAVAPASAQVYRPEGVSRGRGSAHVSHGGRHEGGHVDRHAPSVRVSVGHHGYRGHHGHYSHWGHHRDWGHSHWGSHIGFRLYAPRYHYVPSYGYSYYGGYGDAYPYYTPSPSYGTGYYGTGSAATNGLLLGALAGGIIGHNSGEFRHNGWRGAAWGAGLGWLLGTVADANRRPVVYDSAPVVMPQAQSYQTAPAQSQSVAQPQQVTIINNYYNSSPMSGANGLFGR